MITDKILQKFISNPETFTLFRGEDQSNQNGLHFTTDEVWARKFGGSTLSGRLPADSKIKLLAGEDFEEGYKLGIASEGPLWDLIFKNGYDAIIGHDSMDCNMLDVIVNPKHLKLFKLS
ncbi:MAG: hypothetical protein NTU76_02555 [Candidatus Taylorbacteria bacterium]|nr:hypothetical protein [Candidatus Taylorbacteria bacterium]